MSRADWVTARICTRGIPGENRPCIGGKTLFLVVLGW